MKIFISHSSKDKWAARRIAQDLEESGATVFLDEKDIESGTSIDASIRENLNDSDHFLILLSPASLRSDWVLLELGGALALGKTIIPILLYVGANEIPQAINLKLARDINEVERYYDEVKRKVAGKPAPKPREKSAAQRGAMRFKVGDAVRIERKEPERVFRTKGTDVYWTDGMDRYLGRRGKITRIDKDGDYVLDVDDGRFAWAQEWLAIDSAA